MSQAKLQTLSTYSCEIYDCKYVINEERKPHPGLIRAKLRDWLKELFGMLWPVYFIPPC
jgi:hypothetical protein